MVATARGALTIRRTTDADTPALLALLGASMGWLPDGVHARFFAWKHRQNPFGPSPGWVAIDDSAGGRVAGFRTFLCWEFTHRGDRVRAVRAVDTATHPEYQGRGVFTRLTLAALDELREQDVAFVFNTPNERSLPGYLKMGWEVVGRLPVSVRLASAGSLARLVRAHTAAAKWSLGTEAGISAAQAFSDHDRTAALVQASKSAGRFATTRSPEYLAWRYGFEPLAYRAVLAGDELERGAVVFRLRRRGAAVEAAITEVLVPTADTRTAARLLREVLRSSGADYAMGLRRAPRSGMVMLPRQGPVLAHRELAERAQRPPMRDWALTLGDIELF